MSKFPKLYYKIFPNVLHFLAMPASFIFCALLYQPRALYELMHTAEGMYGIVNIYFFNTAVLCAIITLSMFIGRTLFYFVVRQTQFNFGWYALWCMGEVVLMSVFSSLYFSLMDPSDWNFFYYFGRTLAVYVEVLIFPYLILALMYLYINLSNSSVLLEESSRLKFYDNRKVLKLILPASSVLYIETNENYVIIHYLENGAARKFQLRSTMKSIEPLCESAGFVRIHRCYIANPAHVKMIRKEDGGLYSAVLDTMGSEGIPVSKKYYAGIIALL